MRFEPKTVRFEPCIRCGLSTRRGTYCLPCEQRITYRRIPESEIRTAIRQARANCDAHACPNLAGFRNGSGRQLCDIHVRAMNSVDYRPAIEPAAR